MNKESFSFVVYMIHVCADKWGTSPSEVYKILKRSGCIDGYLVPNYEILHTQGSGLVLDDIEQYLTVRGLETNKSHGGHR